MDASSRCPLPEPRESAKAAGLTPARIADSLLAEQPPLQQQFDGVGLPVPSGQVDAHLTPHSPTLLSPTAGEHRAPRRIPS